MLKFLLYVLFFYLVSRFLFRLLFSSGVPGTGYYRQQGYRHPQPDEEAKANGSGSRSGSKRNKGSDTIGEYVDYEEVK